MGGRIILYVPNKNFIFRKICKRLFPDKYRRVLDAMGHREEGYFSFNDLVVMFRKDNLLLKDKIFIYNLISWIYDIFIFPRFLGRRFLRLIYRPRKYYFLVMIYNKFVIPLLRIIALVDIPFQMCKNSSGVIVIGRKRSN